MAERGGLAPANPARPTAVGLPLVAGSEPPVVLDADPSIVISSAAPGEVSEWLKEHAWKACVPKRYRGFESPPLRQLEVPMRVER
jgi:hypothetical protein